MTITKTFKFQARVDHRDSRDIEQRFQVVGHRIVNFIGPGIHSINGNYTHFLGAYVDSQDTSVLVVRFHVQGNGIRAINSPIIGEIVLDRLGRGWVDAEFKVEAVPLA